MVYIDETGNDGQTGSVKNCSILRDFDRLVGANMGDASFFPYDRPAVDDLFSFHRDDSNIGDGGVLGMLWNVDPLLDCS